MRIYIASKLYHASKLLEEIQGWDGHEVGSRWTFKVAAKMAKGHDPYALEKIGEPHDPVLSRKYWAEDAEDVAKSHVTLVYWEPGDELRGALVEAGMAIGSGKEVVLIGNCPAYAGWRHHPSVSFTSDLAGAKGLIDLMDSWEVDREGRPRFVENFVDDFDHAFSDHVIVIYRQGDDYKLLARNVGIMKDVNAILRRLASTVPTLIEQTNKDGERIAPASGYDWARRAMSDFIAEFPGRTMSIVLHDQVEGFMVVSNCDPEFRAADFSRASGVPDTRIHCDGEGNVLEVHEGSKRKMDS